MVTEEAVRQALGKVQDPELGRSVVELNMIRDIQIDGSRVSLTLALTTLACPLMDSLTGQVRAAVAALPGVEKAEVKVAEMTEAEVKAAYAQMLQGAPHTPGGNGKEPVSFNLGGTSTAPESMARRLSPVSHMIGVTSGKGGVGKSVVAALLASSLRRMGHRVGVFDVDVTGASIPKLFGLTGNLKKIPEGILPHQTPNGIRVVSTNLMLHNPDDPVAYRGSMINSLIKSLWRDVVWGPLDYLILDLPPGTSDAQLTVMSELPLEGLVMVTTPQDLAALIVRKAVRLSRDMNVRLLGIVENMSYFVCPETGTRHEVFGPSHVEEVTALAEVPLLARLPILPALAEASDAGKIEQFQWPEMDAVAEKVRASLPEGKATRDGIVAM